MKFKHLAPVCLLASCGLLWLSGCQSQDKSQADSPVLSAIDEPHASNGLPPKITFAKSSHDFGVVPPNKAHKGQIKFTNTGEGKLTITKVSRCCGVVTKLAGNKSLPAEYAPGESGAVLIEWTSGSLPMDFKREFYVHSNDKAHPSAKLKVSAKIVRKYEWEPKRMRLVLDEDNAGGQEITITSLDGRAFSITSFKSTGDCITADFDPSVEATKFVLVPKVNTSKLHKNLKGRILVGMTHPDGNTAIVLFDVLPQYTMEPPLLSFFYAEPGKPILKKISVLNNYQQDFGIESLTSKAGALGIRVLSTRKLTYGYQLEIEVTPPATEAKMKIMDEFVLALKDGEKISIRCNLWYKKTKPVTAIKTR